MQKKIYDLVKIGIENALFVLFALMVVIVFINVIARFVFNNAITSSEEVARFCLIWLVYIGAALALAENEHLGFDILVNLLPKTGKNVAALFSNIFMLFITALLTVYGMMLAINNIAWPAPATGIPYGIINLILPIAGAFMFVVVIKKLLLTIKSLKTK